MTALFAALLASLLATIRSRLELRRMLAAYILYYHRTRTHLGLQKDTPDHRPTSEMSAGAIVAIRKSVVSITDMNGAQPNLSNCGTQPVLHSAFVGSRGPSDRCAYVERALCNPAGACAAVIDWPERERSCWVSVTSGRPDVILANDTGR